MNFFLSYCISSLHKQRAAVSGASNELAGVSTENEVLVLDRVTGSCRCSIRFVPSEASTFFVRIGGQRKAVMEYRELEKYPGYRVGSDGSVWTCLVRKKMRGQTGGTKCFIGTDWKLLKPNFCATGGYRRVSIRGKSKKVHTLVLEAFVGPRPPGMECRHLDGNPQNAARENLVWGTPKENTRDHFRHGTHVDNRGEKSAHAKLTAEQVSEIRILCAGGIAQKEIRQRFGLSKSCVSKIVSGKAWKNLP